ncbi:MAG: hypothetical protein WAQ53_08890 [Thiofilum sp.]|uniref:esterase/lipase family protein n=1 Tax=Thiofilum sp. TaxID=2212733 RepID=UPI0025CD89D4|nr:hypothetical protein [Thiofilum sp.]MBK8452779.1 alpha/beta hydrolase [Thiofilum sp.]
MKLLRLLLVLSLFWSIEASAKTIVLIHGFQAKGMDWRTNRVTQGLQATGWVDGGHWQPTPRGLWNPIDLPQRPKNIFYTIDLPSTALIEVQAQWLDKYLATIYQLRGEPLELVGHSAGGVVTRYWLLAKRPIPINSLITIASPHVGTPVSNLIAEVMDSPWGRMADDLGLRPLYQASSTLLQQLKEEHPGNFMYWLNHQTHPNLRYISIVRDNQRASQFDFIVPFFSQNMNNVYALHGKSEVWASKGNHFLQRNDGFVINQVLNARF